ncbi:hypothetical protein [Microbacterium maritypicum]|uniref:Uncharacterized protein n=2 Tax=Microbacterium maritypicum TaxID=33918 RepID=A0ACD4B857_MICMQ|nr:hypothetical protein [Microbacterium liquefaciens]UTT53796.1 hypothetical protein NMQ05_04235 [Microbacterium liquefaciens]UTT53862.1 hypothetical protein NMQ05_04570 [Microbacterium liquefaciens]
MVAKKAVVEVPDVLTAQTVDGVVVEPARHASMHVPDRVFVMPRDDIAAGPVDGFHLHTLPTAGDIIMASPTLGTLKVALLAKIANGEAHEIGELSIPITATRSSFTVGEGIRVDERSMMLSLADSLEQAAHSIRRERS